MATQFLRASVRRDSRMLTVTPYRAGCQFRFEDATGTLELLLELLSEGRRTRAELVRGLTGCLDGVCAESLENAIDALDALGLLETVEIEFAGAASVPSAVAA
jgi:hypothetical protein